MTAPIGFVGQGWIGKHYADEFEARGYTTVRYSLEEPYVQNKDKIGLCRLVFVAVPTPTTIHGFDDSLVRSALTVIQAGSTVVIKSTLLPGTTKKLQQDFPQLYVLHSPEFLAEKTAAHDAAHPNRNIIGIPEDTEEYRLRAEEVLAVLPKAAYAQILNSHDAELVKYAGNCFLYTKVIFMNLLYDMVAANQGDWKKVREALIHDPRIGASHTEPVHASGHIASEGTAHRGAGGHCFIKDFEAFRKLHALQVNDVYADDLLLAMARFNSHLLTASGKDTDLLESVYGEELEPSS